MKQICMMDSLFMNYWQISLHVLHLNIQHDEEDCDEDHQNLDGSIENTPTRSRRHSCRHAQFHRHRLDGGDGELAANFEDFELEEEEFSGVSGDISLYQSGPLFSPLKEPPPLGNTTFSVDSLDCESLHEDLILTCQANKDNYTIAFEGSFIQYSEDSDYHEAGG